MCIETLFFLVFSQSKCHTTTFSPTKRHNHWHVPNESDVVGPNVVNFFFFVVPSPRQIYHHLRHHLHEALFVRLYPPLPLFVRIHHLHEVLCFLYHERLRQRHGEDIHEL